MFRLTRKLTIDLALWMTAYGILVGALFPFFADILGVNPDVAYQPRFIAATLTAGLMVGMFNFLVARWVIGPRLSLLADSMQRINSGLLEPVKGGESHCRPDTCRVNIDSEDEFGDCASAFNSLIETLFQQREMDEVVRRFFHGVTTQLDLDNLSEQALGLLLDHTEAVAGALYVSGEGQMRAVTSIGLSDASELAENPHLQRAFSTHRTLLLNLPESVRVDGLLADFKPTQVRVRPVGLKDEPLGVLLLAADAPFSGESCALLDLLGQVLGLALNNAIAHEQLERLTALDPLTGIYNRRFRINRLEEEFSRAVRNETPLGLIILDSSVDRYE